MLKRNLSGAEASAYNVLAGARSQMFQHYGYGAILRPKMWYLALLKLSLSVFPYVIIVVLIASIVLGAWLFGEMSIYYALYFLKACICIIINTFLSIGNAIYFGVHGFTKLLLLAFLDIINGITSVFIVPIGNAINQIAMWLTIIQPGEFLIGAPGSMPDGGNPLFTITPLGYGMDIAQQPGNGFAYYIPASVIGPGASAFGFIRVHPGAEIYVTDDLGNVVYDEFYDQNGAKLELPRIDHDATTKDFWTTIDKPPDITYDPHYFKGFERYTSTFWGTIVNVIQKWWSGLLGNMAVGGVSTISDVVDIIEDDPRPVTPNIVEPLVFHWMRSIWPFGG